MGAEITVVTGAFSHTGKYIAQRLLAMGKTVRTLTGRPASANLFGDKVKAFPFNFDKLGELTDNLRGATTLYNTYWVRFPYGPVTFERAVENSQALIKAAEEAGISRIVHISITSPSLESAFPYFRGKALVEKAIIESRLSYAIIRPTVIFGSEGILINNIAWLLRRFPVFAVPGSGDYRIQPVFVEDVAEIAVTASHSNENVVMDAASPEAYSFDEFVRLIASKIGKRARIVHVIPRLALLSAALIGDTVKDVLITNDEIKGLMSNLLISQGEPLGQTRFSDWLELNAGKIGIKYASELQRHYR